MDNSKYYYLNGMGLAENFYNHYRQQLVNSIPDILEIAAIGLAGEGSECFGVDDEHSRDHDFGAGFCIWLESEKLNVCLNRLQAALANLPDKFLGFKTRLEGRLGPIAIEDFYYFFTGLKQPPESWQEWLAIPEFQLAAATNGKIFEDNTGNFSQWRKKLLNFYPQDVWLKKIAARVMTMAQTGQYNLPRVLKRDDLGAALLTVSKFSEAALSFVFLINKKYMPFYKWAPKLVKDLPVLGGKLSTLLYNIPNSFQSKKDSVSLCENIENFCSDCSIFLRNTGLSDAQDTWLWAHGPQIAKHIENKEIKKMDLLKD